MERLPRTTDFSEIRRNVDELHEASQILQEYQRNPEEFWISKHEVIARGLSKRFDDSPHPENQIIIPIHRNLDDLGPLLLALAGQKFDEIGTTRLTFIMHNNNGKYGKERDFSWDIAESLKKRGAPIDIQELSDPLLTGPFISWQYGLAINQATSICAVLDADSIPTKNWFSALIKPLALNPSTLASAGRRIHIQTTPVDKLIRTIHTVRDYSDYIRGEENSAEFTGGQAAYRSDRIREEVKKIYGLPDGDTLLSNIITEEYGKDAIKFAHAPVLNIVTNPVRIQSRLELTRKIKKAATLFAPKPVRDRLVPPVTEEEQNQYAIRRIRQYSPWSRDIIDAFQLANTQRREFTTTDALDMFAQTAKLDGFYENSHVQKLLTEGLPDTVLTGESLFTMLHHIGSQSLGPTLKEHIHRSQVNEISVY